MDEQHLLLIPPTGLLEVIHTDKQVDVEETLRLRCDNHDAPCVTVNLERNGEAVGKLAWIVNYSGPLNTRAREALDLLCGVHMVFTGHVMFADVSPEQVYTLVSTLSRKD